MARLRLAAQQWAVSIRRPGRSVQPVSLVSAFSLRLIIGNKQGPRPRRSLHSASGAPQFKLPLCSQTNRICISR